jgi:hypothetical protein
MAGKEFFSFHSLIRRGGAPPGAAAFIVTMELEMIIPTPNLNDFIF